MYFSDVIASIEAGRLGYSPANRRKILGFLRRAAEIYDAPATAISADPELFTRRWGRGRITTYPIAHFKSTSQFSDWRTNVRGAFAQAAGTKAAGKARRAALDRSPCRFRRKRRKNQPWLSLQQAAAPRPGAARRLRAARWRPARSDGAGPRRPLSIDLLQHRRSADIARARRRDLRFADRGTSRRPRRSASCRRCVPMRPACGWPPCRRSTGIRGAPGATPSRRVRRRRCRAARCRDRRATWTSTPPRSLGSSSLSRPCASSTSPPSRIPAT